MKRVVVSIPFLVAVNDIVVAAMAWALAYLLRMLGTATGWSMQPVPPWREYLPFMLLSCAVTPLVFARMGLYRPKRTKSMLGEIADVAKAVGLLWGITGVAAAMTLHVRMSRMLILALLPAWGLLACVNRLLARLTLRSLRRHGWNLRRAAIIGTGRLAQKLAHVLERNVWTGIRPVYFIGAEAAPSTVAGLPVHGPADRAAEVVRAHPVDVALVAMGGENHKRIREVLTQLTTVNVSIHVVPDLLSYQFLRHDVTQLDNIPIIHLTHTPQVGWGAVLKRGFDFVTALVGLIVMAVPMLVIAVLVKCTSRGRVFYVQTRTSLSGEPFRIIKFRTMRENAEAETGPVWADTLDQRATPPGRFLRRTGLDELPQLLNVLLGHMSLVGPRPERPELIEHFRQRIPRYMLRSQVRAGLTGWAQVHGLRGRTSLRKRVQYDLYYITHWSFWLDLRILWMTLFGRSARRRRVGDAHTPQETDPAPPPSE